MVHKTLTRSDFSRYITGRVGWLAIKTNMAREIKYGDSNGYWLVRNIHPKSLTWLAGRSTMNEDVFPIEDGDFPASHVSFLGNQQFTPVRKNAYFTKRNQLVVVSKFFSSMFLLPKTDKLRCWEVGLFRSDSIHVWYICLHLPLKINHPCRYSKYTGSMDGMGFVSFTEVEAF